MIYEPALVFVATCRRYGGCLLKLRGSMTAAIRIPLSFDQVLGAILLPVSFCRLNRAPPWPLIECMR